MAYNQALAQRIRLRFEHLGNCIEKEMMGGLTFMYNDKMCVGIIGDELMCRINPLDHEKAVEEPGCRTMDFTKTPMKGYVMISPEFIIKEKDLDYWIEKSIAFNPLAKASKKKKK